MIDLRNIPAMYVGNKPVKQIWLGNKLVRDFARDEGPYIPPIDEPEEPTPTVYVQVVTSNPIQEDVSLNCTGTLEIRGIRRKRPYVFNFYSDAARTVPMSVSNLQLNVRVGHKFTYGDVFTYTTDQITVNGTSHTYLSSFFIYEAYTACNGTNIYFEGIVQVDDGTTYVVNQDAYVQPSPPVFIEPEPPVVDPTKLIQAGLRFGVAVRKEFLTKEDEKALVESEALEITSENELKTSRTFPTATTTNFVIPDQQVAWAQLKGKRYHGHTLWWIGKEPQWVKDRLNDPATTVQQAKDLLKYMIQTPVLRYKGRIVSWDVLNEPVKPGSKAWNTSAFITKIGVSALKLALQYAHEADPDCILLVNEFDWEYGGNKMTFLHTFISECEAESVPLHGIGLQMHRLVKNVNESGIRTQLSKLADTGLKIRISEIGLQLRYSPYIINNDNSTFILTEGMQDVQGQKMVALVNAWQTLVPDDQKLTFNTWGMFDFNYKNNKGEKEYAMMWDGSRNRKKAYTMALAEMIRLNDL